MRNHHQARESLVRILFHQLLQPRCELFRLHQGLLLLFRPKFDGLIHSEKTNVGIDGDHTRYRFGISTRPLASSSSFSASSTNCRNSCCCSRFHLLSLLRSGSTSSPTHYRDRAPDILKNIFPEHQKFSPALQTLEVPAQRFFPLHRPWLQYFQKLDQYCKFQLHSSLFAVKYKIIHFSPHFPNILQKSYQQPQALPIHLLIFTLTFSKCQILGNTIGQEWPQKSFF